MAKTTIEWATDVWNPVTGCTKVSEGCRNCYAEQNAKRFWGNRPFTEVRCHEHKLEEPLHWRKPRKVFVNSMSDLFHPDVPFSFIDRVFAVMALTPHITYMVLTKRPKWMLGYFSTGDPEDFWADRWPTAMMRLTGESEPTVFPLPNVWLGVTAENQQTADERIPLLLQTPAAVRFASVEPMLGAVNLTGIQRNLGRGLFGDCLKPYHIPACEKNREYPHLDWVICGGESGPNARPMHPDWARSLRDQCKAAGTPFMFKQWGEWAPGSNFLDTIPASVSCDFEQELSDDEVVWKVGKKAAGRLLDGVEYNEYPEVQNG